MADQKQVEAVRKLAAGEVEQIEVVDEYTDDHIPCAKVELDGVRVDFLWIGSAGVGAFTYPESKKAQKTIKEMAEQWLQLEEE